MSLAEVKWNRRTSHLNSKIVKPKKSKTKTIYFFNFASWRTFPTQSTGPQPIQLVPKHLFLQISRYRSLKSKNFKKQGAFFHTQKNAETVGQNQLF